MSGNLIPVTLFLQLTVAGVSGSLGACARGHVVQEYKPGHENAIIHDQLTEESNVPDQAERLVLVTRMIVQVLVVFKPQKTPISEFKLE